MQILYGAQMSIFRAFHNGWPTMFLLLVVAVSFTIHICTGT